VLFHTRSFRPTGHATGHLIQKKLAKAGRLFLMVSAAGKQTITEYRQRIAFKSMEKSTICPGGTCNMPVDTPIRHQTLEI